MEIYLKDNSKIILDPMGCIGIKMETHTKELGKMMWNKDLASLSYQMDNIMKANLQKAINMEKEYIDGQMEMYMMGTFN